MATPDPDPTPIALIVAWIAREAGGLLRRRRADAREDRSAYATAGAAEAEAWTAILAAQRQLGADLAIQRDECRRDHALALARIATLERERDEDRTEIGHLRAQIADVLASLAGRATDAA